VPPASEPTTRRSWPISRLHDRATGADLEVGEHSPREYDDAYLASVRETTQLLAAEGIWTLLDFHQDLYSERFKGEGAPDWAITRTATQSR
jgi:hypothetical protein